MIDTAKAIAGVFGRRCAALPTTLSGAEMTPFHRTPAGVEGARLVRPALVVADPDLMATQPGTQLAASAMNAMAHAMEALYTPFANPVGDGAALAAASALPRRASRADPPDTDATRSRSGPRGLRVGRGRDRDPPRDLPERRARGRHAARRDKRGDAAPQRSLHDRSRPRGARAARRGARSTRRPSPTQAAGAPVRARRALRPHAPVDARGGGGARGRGGGHRRRRIRCWATRPSRRARPRSPLWCARRSEVGSPRHGWPPRRQGGGGHRSVLRHRGGDRSGACPRGRRGAARRASRGPPSGPRRADLVRRGPRGRARGGPHRRGGRAAPSSRRPATSSAGSTSW